MDKTAIKGFVDILEERRKTSDILWASRSWNAATAYLLPYKYTPAIIKSTVLHSYRLRQVIRKLSNEKNVSPNELYITVNDILTEIGYDRKVSILRWLGLIVAKLLKKLLTAVYVNEGKFLDIKSQFGRNPVLFVPSHRSYCDFIIMSYICFNYEVDIPRIAAGMDFQSMAVIGNILRDACAFFMRRSFNNDELYSAVFSQYVQTLVVDGDAAIEFFIEGTRSRTAKSLMPKFGFLSMALKPFFTGLVPDITIVPVTLSYERVLEEVLFAYELLGVPKPKESTKGFLKALSILNENYGNIYVQFGDPFSVKNYFSNKIDRSIHWFGSVEMQDLSPEESQRVKELAYTVVSKQTDLTIFNCFNLIAAVLNDHFLRQFEPLALDNLIVEVKWLLSILKSLAPATSTSAINFITEETVVQHLKLHKLLVCLSANRKVQLCRIHSQNSITDVKKLKGHPLLNSTMDISIPLLMLQNYVNPCANFLVSVCFIALIAQSNESFISIDELLNNFQFLCSIFSHEFIFRNNSIPQDFNEAFDKSKILRLISVTDDNKIGKGDNKKLHLFCINFLSSYIPGYIVMVEVLLGSVGAPCFENQLLKACQERLESKLNSGSVIHPANLSLDLLTNALQSFVTMKAVSREKRNNSIEYHATEGELKRIHSKLKSFDFSNEARGNLLQQFSVFTRASL